MNFVLAFTLALIVGSVALMLFTVKHYHAESRHTIRGAFIIFLVALSVVLGQLMPGGVIRTTTQGVFVVTAAVFFGVELYEAFVEWRDKHLHRSSNWK